MTQAPVPSVTAVRLKPVSVCVAVTVTPGNTAPLSSVTRPASSAVAWPQAIPAARTTPSRVRDRSRRTRVIFMALFLQPEAFLGVDVWNAAGDAVLVVLGADEFHQLGVGRKRAGRELQLDGAGERARIVEREVVGQ